MKKNSDNNLLNQKFGDWTVVGNEIKTVNNQNKILCKCICGSEREVRIANLKSGRSTGCGCKRKGKSNHIQGYSHRFFDTKGELLIEQELIKMKGVLIYDGIKNLPDAPFYYEKQGWVNEKNIKFDFLITADELMAIEFDGEFHFKNILKNKQIELFNQYNRDLTKNERCENEFNIPLLRIRYDQLDQISFLINDLFENPDTYKSKHNPIWDNYYDETKENIDLLFRNK